MAFDVLDYSGGFSFVLLLCVNVWVLLVYSKFSITKITQVLTRLLLFVTVLPLQLQKEAKMLPLWSGQIRYVTMISFIYSFVGKFLAYLGTRVPCRF